VCGDGPQKTAAILLAAGESTRMGTLKALLPWESRTLFDYQVSQLLSAPIERLVVVLGFRAADLRPMLPPDPRVEVVLNPDFASGKVSSIVAGVAAAPSGRNLLILGVDQPRPADLVDAVIQSHGAPSTTITVAGYGGRRGHPVVFAPELRPELLAISEETEGLRSVLQAHAGEVRVVDTGDPIALVNLNTPEDYERALALSSASSARAGNQ
jgi:molybdenum cofactor cytidylyltransferase